MPREIAFIEKVEWLKAHHMGEPHAKIAKRVGRDVRTVKKGIEEARRAQDSQTARTELVKDALQKHQHALLDVVRRILSALVVPPHNLELPLEGDNNPPPIPLSGATASYESVEGWTVTLHDENTTLWKLLQEHLKRDPMWNALARWKKAIAAHLNAIIALKRKTAMLLEEKTGLKLVDRPPEQGPYLFLYVAVPLLYEMALHAALGIPDGRDPEHDIVADTKNGEVTYRNSRLAKVPGAEEECRKKILEALADLRASTEAKDVAATYRQVEVSTAKTRRVVEEIALLGLVLGQCRVCRRLGV